MVDVAEAVALIEETRRDLWRLRVSGTSCSTSSLDSERTAVTRALSSPTRWGSSGNTLLTAFLSRAKPHVPIAVEV